MADRDSSFGKNQIKDRTITQLEFDFTNTPTDGQLIQINMPTGDFTAVDIANTSFKQTFTNADLTADKITITHSLSIDYPVVIVYDNNNNVIFPSEITYLTDDTIQLDFTGVTPLTGNYQVRVIGAIGTTGTFLQAFTNPDLSSGILTVTHSLNTQYVLVTIYDNSNNVIEPNEFTATSTTVLTVDLSAFGSITGTWRIRIVG